MAEVTPSAMPPRCHGSRKAAKAKPVTTVSSVSKNSDMAATTRTTKWKRDTGSRSSLATRAAVVSVVGGGMGRGLLSAW